MSNPVVSIFLGAFIEAGKLMASGLLEQVKAHNTKEDYEAVIQSLGNAFALLEKAAAKTKGKADDKIVDLFKTPIDAAAEADGIEI